MDYAGAGSFFIIVLISLFVGMALSLQLAAELSAVGLKMYSGKIVGISIIRSWGRWSSQSYIQAGSAQALHLARSMVLGHQVDTLRVFGVDPIKNLSPPEY